MQFGFVTKGMFFDREAVMRRVHRAKMLYLNRAGAGLRLTAQRLLRYGKGTSAPGSPPVSHKPNAYLRRRLLYGYDRGSDSVVVGPEKLNVLFFDGDGRPVRGAVPGVLEHGGAIRILEVLKPQGWRRADLRSRRRLAGLQTRLRAVRIAPRPYMAPALQRYAPKLPGLWARLVA